MYVTQSKHATFTEYHLVVSGGKDAPMNGDNWAYPGPICGRSGSSVCVEGAVVLATVKDAARRFATAFGRP
jgi:hypothetical protein